MEDILDLIYDPSSLKTSRTLVTANTSLRQQLPVNVRWKNAVWEKNSIEPAMLRVPIVIVTLVVLWGLNIWGLERNRMQYYGVLSVKSAPIPFVFIVAVFLAVMYAMNMTIMSTVLRFSVETGVMTFYFVFLVLALFPFNYGQELRASFWRLLKLVFSPSSSITFPEVLLADAMTSLSKVFKDIGVTLVAIYAQFSSTDIVVYHWEGMILVAILASLPYGLRVRQCWVQYDCTNDAILRLPIVLNIIKYLSAFPPIWLAAAASLGYFHPDLPAIAAAMATINSLYSFAWDIVMDWGLITFYRTGKVVGRKRVMFPWYTYVFAVSVNLLLRFSWAANRIPALGHLHASHLVLMVEIGEVMRRAMWNMFRIEWEMIVQQERAAVLDQEEADKMLVKIPKAITSTGNLSPS